MSLMVLSQQEVQQCITMKQAISIMDSAFKEYYAKKTVLPLRTPVVLEQENGLMFTMPAYLSQQKALGLKVVSVFPDNATLGKPAINGVLLVMSEQTGEALAIMEAGYLTALRTGAVSGLATQYLARDDAKHLAIIGSGVQAMTQLEAVTAVRPIEQISIWSRNFDKAKQFAQQISTQFKVQCVPDIKDAVKDADIICTATSSTEPMIHLNDLKDQVHINAVGSHSPAMREIANDVLADAMVVVDQVEAALKEAGEVISALQNQYIQQEDIIELGSIVTHFNTENKPEKTIFKSVGLAIQDVSIAHAVYLNALSLGLGTSIPLMQSD
jgi:ornithine cyclodeaminase